MNSGDQQRIEAPPFSDRRIVEAAEELTRNYVRATNPNPAILTINFDHVYENYIYPIYGIALEEDCNLGQDEQGNKILGRFDVETNTGVHLTRAWDREAATRDVSSPAGTKSEDMGYCRVSGSVASWHNSTVSDM